MNGSCIHISRILCFKNLIGFAIAQLCTFNIWILYWDGLKDVKKPEIPVNEYKLAKKLLIFRSPIIITVLES